jgi:adenylate kinase
MLVALTGTPGTGKSSAAAVMRKRGHYVVSVEELAREHDAGIESQGGLVVDTQKLSSSLCWKEDSDFIIEGHLAHHLPNTLCIVMRCHPDRIKSRLMKRGYDDDKIRENMEAEAVDLILIEAVEACSNVFEINASDIRPEDVADAIESIINGKSVEFSPGNVDWSQVVMDWY